MPFNAHAQTLGPKSSKPPASKNVPTAASVKKTTPAGIQTQAMNPPETTNANRSLGKTGPGAASANQALPVAKLPPQEVVDEVNSGIGVNKKKQKRRQKEAARKAAEQHLIVGPQKRQGHMNESAYEDIVHDMAEAQAQGQTNGLHYEGSDYEDPENYEPEDGDDIYYTDDPNRQYQINYAPPQPNGRTHHTYGDTELLGGKSKKKKKPKGSGFPESAYTPAKPMSLSPPRSFHPPPPPPPPPSGTHQTAHHDSKDRIWNTSTAEERERIKEFWLSLGEEDRRSLVKVEKEAVLKKMKEQQKQSCSCTVCGRKRTAIEEELEVLYDAYYVELEQYANGDGCKRSNEDGTRIAASNGTYPHPMARLPPNRHPQSLDRRSSRGRIREIGDENEAADDEDYSEDEDDEDLSDEELAEEPTREAVDFFNFGKNLTVQGGILTVADDLLKNDGKKFIEMMEQLAERRMQREEEAQFAANGLGHNHGPSPNDEEYDEEDDEEYDSQVDDEDFDDEDEMESTTEIQRMDEGRRMFQIFAARMFEQRVLSAYREKVSRERQQKLIEELDAESRVDAQREAKKAKEAQKKKEKKRQQKLAKDEERAKREAAKAAEEAAAKALEEKKAEELRQKKEEHRKKKDAEKKAQEEERQRKEVEKHRRLQEAKDQQAEQDRKQREQKEREKKKREETKRREREEREAKEAEARQKREREAVERREREAKARVETQAKEQNKKDNPNTKKSAPTIAKRPSPVYIPSSAVSLPPGLHPPNTTSSHASPHLQVATPVIPKAPTPVRPRQPSLQEPHNVTSKTSQPASSSTTSPSISSAQQIGTPCMPSNPTNPSTIAQQSQPPSRYSPLGSPPSQVSLPSGFSSMPAMAGNGFSAAGSPLPPITQQIPYVPTIHPNQPPIGSSQYRTFGALNGMPFPPGMNVPRQMPQALARMVDSQPPQMSPGGFPSTSPIDVGRYGMSRDHVPSQSHSRNTSASYDRPTFEIPSMQAPTQLNKYPAPIQRPSSVAPHQQGQDDLHANTDIDDLSNHLGSKALLGDNDIPLDPQPIGSRQASMAPGAPRTVRQGFATNQGFSDPFSPARNESLPRGMHNGNGNSWPIQQSLFGNSPMSGPQSWSNTSGFGRANNNNTFGTSSGPVRGNVTRPLILRILVRTACEKLASRALANTNGWHRAEDVHREILIAKHTPAHESQVSMQDMLAICDTEGNQQNGGGSFSTFTDQAGLYIRFESGQNAASLSGRGAPGDIGSPIIGGAAMPAIGGQRSFQANY